MRLLHVVSVLLILVAAGVAELSDTPSRTRTVSASANPISSILQSLVSWLWSAVSGEYQAEEVTVTAGEQADKTTVPTVRLSDWMGDLSAVIGELAFLDFAFPGSHDTVTFDLSYKTAEGDFENSTLVKVLRALPKWLVPSTFIKGLGKAQAMRLKDQLENGIRFLDFRIMYTSGAWRGVHFSETHKKAVEFAKTIKAFLDDHPTEIVTIFFSRHGNTCFTGNDQYPEVSAKKKREFWKKVKDIFGNVLLNHETSPLDITTYNDLIHRGERLVVYAADYDDMIGGDSLAADACKFVTNSRPGNAYTLNKRDSKMRQWFDDADEIQDKFKSEKKFNILPLSCAVRDSHVELLAWITYWPLTRTKNIKECAKLFGDSLKGIKYCPEDLLRHGQMVNYYSQLALDYATQKGAAFPNAMIVDSLDKDGTMRVDATNPSDRANASRYSFAPTIILANIRKACHQKLLDPEGAINCKSALEIVTKMRSRFPTKLWDDKESGRLRHFFETE